MTSVRIPFESYAAQHNVTNSNLSTYVGQSANANKMNNFNTTNTHHSSFQFKPRSHFAINSVEEEEIPEEKMHSPRTPYGSVPDPINNNTANNNNNNNRNNNDNNGNSRWLYPPHANQTVNPLDQMQRTVSASSMDSIVSFSAQSTTMEHENILNMPVNYTPTLSATSSINRSGTYSTSTSPDASPIGSPKAYKLRKSNSYREEQKKRQHQHHQYRHIRIHTDETKEEEDEEEEEVDSERKYSEEYEEKTQSFSSSRPSSTKYVDTDDRNVSIEAIAKALLQVKNKKRNGFHLYRHGLSTYSNGTNSGVNTNGTATPNSIGALSRSSSCNEMIGGSECSFDEPHDGEHVADDGEYIDSGASTPFEPDVTALNTTKLAEFSEDEMETPVPTSTTEHNQSDESPFDFDTRLPIPILAEISEDVEHETINTPNTNITIVSGESKESEEDHIILHELEETAPHFDIIDDDSSDDDEEPIPQEIHSPNPMIGMKLVNDGDDEEDDELCMDLEDEIILKGSRFQSSRVLFLDVDGVLLSVSEQAKLGKGENIKFNDDVTSLMIKICRETDCDIVISSTWQFYKESHLKYLTAYLIACGWTANKIHTLLDLLPSHANDGINYGREWYEQSPYCRCRARGIQKIVALYGQYISRWCCLDDLPLHSQKPVCIPKKEDITSLVDEISNAYFKPFEWRKHQKSELMPDIKYCVKYAITTLPNCIFSSQSYRFGYEYNQTMIYYQADAIAKLCKLTYEIKDNVTYQLILQGMIAVINGYIGANLTYQGDPYIAPFLVQTDQSVGITPQNIENVITLLTYQDINQLQQRQLQINSQHQPQLNDNNNTMNTAEVTTV